jgi:hypothetical protein
MFGYSARPSMMCKREDFSLLSRACAQDDSAFMCVDC